MATTTRRIKAPLIFTINVLAPGYFRITYMYIDQRVLFLVAPLSTSFPGLFHFCHWEEVAPL
jgi:hypothetical protein